MTRTKDLQTPFAKVDYLHLVKKEQGSIKRSSSSSLISKIPVYKALRDLVMNRVKKQQGMTLLINENTDDDTC